jgi:hypothetical protein
MDSTEFISKSDIEAWAIPHFKKVVKEISDSNGKVTNITKNTLFIEIMSKISNVIRYDTISKDSVVTYSIPSNYDKILGTSIFFQ